MRLGVAGLGLIWVTGAQAQPGQALADAATFGAVATLAPLCGLRDEAWSFDLRRAALLAATGSTATSDAEILNAPDSGKAEAALGYADMEALEDLAADKPEAVCAALRANPALGRADAAVAAFRRLRDGKPVG
nr:hypothetical protein [uncultured Rhodopila sp.]